MAEDPHWSVDSLFGLTGDAFERERSRIIREYLQSLPEEKRQKAHLLQLNIDLKRGKMKPAEFNQWICHELAENLANLEDQMTSLKHLVDGPPVR